MARNEIWIASIKAFIFNINPEPFAAANPKEMDAHSLDTAF